MGSHAQLARLGISSFPLSSFFFLNLCRFGYDIDSRILDELALEGNGTFSFIPDSSMVGTVFINVIANFLVTIANQSPSITFKPAENITVNAYVLFFLSLFY